MLGVLLLPFALQGLAMFADEFVFHRRRGLPRWERIGHPLDTLTAALCYGWLVAVPAKSPHALGIYLALCAFSCLFITKDELVHAGLCEPLEIWLHSLLFVLHPIVFLALGILWYSGGNAWVVKGVLGSTLGLLSYQVVYWNWLRGGGKQTQNLDPMAKVNNEVYTTLGERWYSADDDPIALLRAESRLRNPWIAAQIARSFGSSSVDVLDVGCGGGFLSNHLGSVGHRVVGLDGSQDALAIASRFDRTGRVRYQQGDALRLPFDAASFDVVCAMDFLEHVENPDQVIAEASRVLKPSGLFFFHTFNRNLLSWLIVIKGVECFVRNTPPNLHVLRLFLKPAEIRSSFANHGLVTVEIQGVRPKLGSAFWKMLFTRRVSADFAFQFTKSTGLGFSGIARKPRPDAHV